MEDLVRGEGAHLVRGRCSPGPGRVCSSGPGRVLTWSGEVCSPGPGRVCSPGPGRVLTWSGEDVLTWSGEDVLTWSGEGAHLVRGGVLSGENHTNCLSPFRVPNRGPQHPFVFLAEPAISGEGFGCFGK